MLCSRVLHMMAVDVVALGLQKRPISAKVLREGIWKLSGPGIVVDKVTKPEDKLVLQLKARDESKLTWEM